MRLHNKDFKFGISWTSKNNQGDGADESHEEGVLHKMQPRLPRQAGAVALSHLQRCDWTVVGNVCLSVVLQGGLSSGCVTIYERLLISL